MYKLVYVVVFGVAFVYCDLESEAAQDIFELSGFSVI